VTDVHPQRDLGLLSISSEGSLADEDPNEQATVEVRELWQLAELYRTGCFTVKKNVKPGRAAAGYFGARRRVRRASPQSLRRVHRTASPWLRWGVCGVVYPMRT
jgi:hypothetical protein